MKTTKARRLIGIFLKDEHNKPQLWTVHEDIAAATRAMKAHNKVAPGFVNAENLACLMGVRVGATGRISWDRAALVLATVLGPGWVVEM